MSSSTLLVFVAGLGLLIAGAELFVAGAARLARSLGISPLVIGLTVVAFGTSSPELAVTIKSALSGQPGLALGNVVGSNIFNVLLILGAAALVRPLLVSVHLIRRDVPILIAGSVLFWGLASSGTIERLAGLGLVAGLAAYTVWTIRESRKESAEARAEYEEGIGGKYRGVASNVVRLVTGLALLALGSDWLVEAAVSFARAMGVSDLTIGLTIVAAGTGLPEAATSVLATIRGHRDIAVGNVVGSNIFNLLGVIGISALLSPSGIPVPPAALGFDIPFMVATSVACLPVFFVGARISRWEGAVFVTYYGAYLAYLILVTKGHDALRTFSAVMWGGLTPLAALTLSIFVFREWKSRRT